MYPTFLALVLALIFMDAALLVDAGLYVRVSPRVLSLGFRPTRKLFQVIQPSQGSTCRGGESCTITWLDDGSRPLLSAIGVSTVGLFTGKQVRRNWFDPPHALRLFWSAEIGAKNNTCGCYLYTFHHLHGMFREFHAATVLSYL